MKRALRQTCYISIENNDNIGYQLFNIAYLINILNKSASNHIKRKIVFRKGNPIYSDSIFKGLFTVLEDDKYDKEDDRDDREDDREDDRDDDRDEEDETEEFPITNLLKYFSSNNIQIRGIFSYEERVTIIFIYFLEALFILDRILF